MSAPIGFLLANARAAARDADDLAADLASARMALAAVKAQRNALRGDLRRLDPKSPALAAQDELFDHAARAAGAREGLSPREIEAWLRETT